MAQPGNKPGESEFSFGTHVKSWEPQNVMKAPDQLSHICESEQAVSLTLKTKMNDLVSN